MSCRRLGLALLLVPAVVLAAVAVVLVPGATLVPSLIIVPGLAGLVGFTSSIHRAKQRRPLTADGTGSPRQGTDPTSDDDRRRARTVAGSVAGATAAATLVVAGLAVVIGPASVPLVFLAAVALAGWAWSRSGRHRDRPSAPYPVELAPLPGVPRPLVRVLETLSTSALCTEWQRSLAALLAATDPAVRRDIVELRRRYLDELDRRDPDALARWLADRPAPAANPAPFFRGARVVPTEPPVPLPRPHVQPGPSDDLTDPPAPPDGRGP